jgi:hypothetical protein
VPSCDSSRRIRKKMKMENEKQKDEDDYSKEKGE